MGLSMRYLFLVLLISFSSAFWFMSEEPTKSPTEDIKYGWNIDKVDTYYLNGTKYYSLLITQGPLLRYYENLTYYPGAIGGIININEVLKVNPEIVTFSYSDGI